MTVGSKELPPDGGVVNDAAAAASPSMAPKGLQSDAQSAARPSESLAMLAFKRMLQNPSQPKGATPLQCIDPLDLRFFQEVGDSEFIAVEKGSWHPPPAAGLAADLIVCVKSLKPGVLTTPQELRMVVDEARKMAGLRHECLAQLLGLGCYSDASMQDVRSTVFFVERWAGSTTLYAAIRKCQQNGVNVYNPLYTTHDGLRWCLQIARALAYLHSNGITHGDVKLENIMLTDVPAGELSMADAVLVDLKPHRHVALQSRFSPVGGAGAGEASGLGADDAASVASAGTGAMGDEDGSARASSTLHRRSRPVTLQRFSATRQASAVSDAEARVRTASLDLTAAAAGQWAGKQAAGAGCAAGGLRLEAVHKAMALRDASLVKGGDGHDGSTSSLRQGQGRAQTDGSCSSPAPGAGAKAAASGAADVSASAGLPSVPGAAGASSLASIGVEAVAYVSGQGQGSGHAGGLGDDLPALLLDSMPPRRYRPALHLSFDGREGFLGQALFSLLDSSDALAPALPSSSASRDSSKARWLGGGRNRRRQSWGEQDAQTASVVAAAAAAAVADACASLLGGGEGPGVASHAAQAWRSQVVLDPGDFHQAAAVDVATACASGTGVLGDLLRSLHADVEALDVPSTCQASSRARAAGGLTSGIDSPRAARRIERAAGTRKEQGAADEVVVKLLASARRSGTGILKRDKSERAFQRQQSGVQGPGVLQPAEEEVGGWYAGTLTPATSVKPQPGKPKKKVRFTLPTAEEGQATGRDYSLIYRAPELSAAPSAKSRKPHEPTPASDVFSFAVVCYEILSKAAVAPGELTRQGLMDYHHRVINGHREPLKEGWPQQIKDLLSQAWSATPGDRPSASEMVQKLAPLLDNNHVLTALTFPDGLMPKDTGCCCIS